MPPSSSVSIPGSRAPGLTTDALGGVPARDGVRRLASTVALSSYSQRLAASPLRGPETAKTLVTALLNSPKPLRAAALLSAATAIGLRDAVDHPQGELGKAEALATPTRSLHPRNAAYGRSSPSTPVRFLAGSPRRPSTRSPLTLSRAAGNVISPSPSQPSSPRLASVASLGRASGGVAASASFADAFLPPRASPARRPAAVASTGTRIGSPRRPYSPCGIGQRSPARILARVVGAQSPAVTSRARAGLGTNIGVGGEKYESVLNTPRRGATKSLRSTAVYDRFIPTHTSMDMPSSHYLLSSENYTAKSDEYHIPSASGPPPKMLDADALAHQEELARACGINLSKRILAFKLEPPVSHHGDPLHSLWKNAARNKKAMPASQRRRISTIPERCLDAPGLVDDYYLNLLDWSSSNLLAVGLEDMVYVWNAATGEVSEFCSAAPGGGAAAAGAETPAGSVCSVRWSADGSHLAVGTGAGDTVIYDGETGAVVRSMGGHAARVGAVAWDRHLVSSGCRDGSIWHHDVRVARHKVSELAGHSAEVCGLRWRADGAMLASGGNDNLVNIWDARSSVPKFTKGNHTAAVKAIGWCPWQLNLLATGGGTLDRHVHFWNTQTGAKLSSIDTGSQVTSIIWSTDFKELLTTHGYPHNQLSLWSYPSLAKVLDLPGHDARVLHAAISPDGETVVSAAGDENLKFWKVFERRGGKGAGAGAAAGGVAGAAAAVAKDGPDEELIRATRAMTIR